MGYQPQDGDRIIIIEDVITAGTAVRETMPILKACADVKVPHMFISVDRCEVGHTPGKTAIMEVQEEFGLQVHPIVTVVGHPRVFERPRHRPGAPESHGGLYGAVPACCNSKPNSKAPGFHRGPFFL